MHDLIELEKGLDVHLNDYSLLSRALTHRSYLNENPAWGLEDNERLEFLGDAVLDFLVGDYLYHRLPEASEGDLTALRAALVRTESLAGFAKQFQLGAYLRLGTGEDENGGRDRTPILCGAFEAVIGAIYLDQGLEAVQKLLDRLIPERLRRIFAESLHKDSKSEFQIWAQGRFNTTPRYNLVESAGPDHARVFTMEVKLDDKIWGRGSGSSKQVAAQRAAEVAMGAALEYEDDLEDEPPRHQ